MQAILADHNDVPSYSAADFNTVLKRFETASTRLHICQQHEKGTRWFNGYQQTACILTNWHTLSGSYTSFGMASPSQVIQQSAGRSNNKKG
jgi:hypothetical protein